MSGRCMITRTRRPTDSARTVKSKSKKIVPSPLSASVGRALRRAAKAARKTARMHGTPIYIWKDGKVVAEKP